MPPALLLIDVQKGFEDPHWGLRNNPEAEQQIARLLATWRERGWPVVHAQHMSQSPESPLRPGQPGNDFKSEALPLPGEPVFQKTVNSAFIGTDLEPFLRGAGLAELVVVGITTDQCVSTTVRMAANLGFRVRLVEDATATFGRRSYDGQEYSAEEIHRLALVSLHGEFADVVSAAELLALDAAPGAG